MEKLEQLTPTKIVIEIGMLAGEKYREAEPSADFEILSRVTVIWSFQQQNPSLASLATPRHNAESIRSGGRFSSHGIPVGGLDV
jgi:hypothetical protein